MIHRLETGWFAVPLLAVCGGIAGGIIGILVTCGKRPKRERVVDGVIFVMAHVDEILLGTAQTALGYYDQLNEPISAAEMVAAT